MPSRKHAASFMMPSRASSSGRRGRGEREKDLWTCTVWAKAAQKTHLSDFICMNYSVTDSYRCHQAEAVLPEPGHSVPLWSTLILSSPPAC